MNWDNIVKEYNGRFTQKYLNNYNGDMCIYLFDNKYNVIVDRLHYGTHVYDQITKYLQDVRDNKITEILK